MAKFSVWDSLAHGSLWLFMAGCSSGSRIEPQSPFVGDASNLGGSPAAIPANQPAGQGGATALGVDAQVATRTDVSTVILSPSAPPPVDARKADALAPVGAPSAMPPFGSPPGQPCIGSPKVKVIFDTDIGPDCDDAGAVAILHAMADRCEVQILGMTSVTSSEWGAPALDAMNTYYGRPDIPIGTIKEAGFLLNSAYNKEVAQNFPNDLKSAKNAPEAVALIKELLTAQPDGSVTLVSVGPLRNARNLIASPGGRDLVAKKVKEWVVMGGWYTPINDGEWNFKQDGAAAREAVENWPTPITFSGAELGGITSGSLLAAEGDENNPVRRAYQISPGVGDSGRLSWDLEAVLYAVRGVGPYFKAVTGGYNEVHADGTNVWKATPNRNHAYLKQFMNPKLFSWVLDELILHAPKERYPKSAPLQRIGWTATASPGMDSAAKAIDNDDESKWSTGRPMMVGDWIAIDMGKAQMIDRIEVSDHWPGGEFPRGYDLFLSDDGQNWGSPVVKGKGANITLIAFPARLTRHFKIVQTGTLSAQNKNLGRPWQTRSITAFFEGT